MRSKVFVPGPKVPVCWLGATVPQEMHHREIPKALMNSDQHLMWRVYHAQPRFGLQRISRADHGEPGAVVLESAGFCFELGQPKIPSDSPPALRIARCP